MIIETIDVAARNKLSVALNTHLQSLRTKRGISVSITAQASDCAVILLSVNGAKGTASKQIILIATNGEWKAYCDNKQYSLLLLSDISVICKSMVNNLAVMVNKL